MRRQPPKPASWDGAPSVRTWDVWVETCLILGLLEVHRHFPEPRYLEAACRIGDLCRRALTDGGLDITDLGNHHGLSATVLLDAACELHLASGERRWLDLAWLVLEQAERNPNLALLTRALGGADASEIATGKAYQLIWNITGLAKLHRATGDARCLQAAANVWRNIRAHHLTLGGGPWGGVGQRSREVFNPPAFFSPCGYVETCSILAWMQLSRELLAITGEAVYAEEIERSAYNDLLGAQAPNGEDWCYYSFPNGRRVHTTSWRCCKSSGALALEELSRVAYARSRDGAVVVNLLGPSQARFDLPGVGTVCVEQRTSYPFEGEVSLRIDSPAGATTPFPVRIRIPQWAQGASARTNGASAGLPAEPGAYLEITRSWRSGDTLDITLPMPVRTHRRSNRNVQESRAPDGSAVEQEVLRYDYLAITRGPLAYAAELIDGYKTEETLRVPDAPDEAWLEEVAGGAEGVDIRMRPNGRAPLTFAPYYRAGGRRNGAWRLTWMSI
jgi:uncharacterized protein